MKRLADKLEIKKNCMNRQSMSISIYEKIMQIKKLCEWIKNNRSKKIRELK